MLFSGDKLLGGPQAGIIAGRADLIDQLKRHPLARVLRSDKATIAALAATLQHYVLGEAESAIPVWRMISAGAEQMRERAQAWADALGVGRGQPSESMIGGGSLPGEALPTFVLAIPQAEPHRLAARLRAGGAPDGAQDGATPVVGRVEHDALLLDPRTVAEADETALLETLRTALQANDA